MPLRLERGGRATTITEGTSLATGVTTEGADNYEQSQTMFSEPTCVSSLGDNPPPYDLVVQQRQPSAPPAPPAPPGEPPCCFETVCR